MKNREPETLTEQVYAAQDIIIDTRDNLFRRIIAWLKPEPMTVQDLNMEALCHYALAGLYLAFGALLLASVAVIRTEKNPAVHPMLPDLVLIFVMWAALTLCLGVIAAVGATWRRHQERKASPKVALNLQEIEEVVRALMAKFPEARR